MSPEYPVPGISTKFRHQIPGTQYHFKSKNGNVSPDFPDFRIFHNCFIDEDPEELHVGSLDSAPCCDENDNEDMKWAMFPKDPPLLGR